MKLDEAMRIKSEDGDSERSFGSLVLDVIAERMASDLRTELEILDRFFLDPPMLILTRPAARPRPLARADDEATLARESARYDVLVARFEELGRPAACEPYLERIEARVIAWRLRAADSSFFRHLVRLRDPNSAGDRAFAAEQLARDFPRPVHAARWPRVAAELRDEAEARGMDPAALLVERVAAALFDAAQHEGLDEFDFPRDEVAAWEHLRTLVNRIVAEDLLGDHWHRRPAESLDHAREREDESSQRARENAELLLALEQSETALTAGEAAYLVAFLRARGSHAEAAQALGIAEGAGRVRLHAARKKIAAST